MANDNASLCEQRSEARCVTHIGKYVGLSHAGVQSAVRQAGRSSQPFPPTLPCRPAANTRGACCTVLGVAQAEVSFRSVLLLCLRVDKAWSELIGHWFLRNGAGE